MNAGPDAVPASALIFDFLFCGKSASSTVCSFFQVSGIQLFIISYYVIFLDPEYISVVAEAVNAFLGFNSGDQQALLEVI